VTAKIALAYCDFMNMAGVVNYPAQPDLTDGTAPVSPQKGNALMEIDPTAGIRTASASAFRELNLTGSLDLGCWQPVHPVLCATR
jgi:hypothetical protein